MRALRLTGGGRAPSARHVHPPSHMRARSLPRCRRQMLPLGERVSHLYFMLQVRACVCMCLHVLWWQFVDVL